MTNFREGSPLNKRQKLIRGAAIVIASHGGISAPPAAEVTPFLDMTTSEQMATIVTDAGKAADDISSADDLVKEGEAIDHQLTSEADAHPTPETNPDGDDTKTLLDLAGEQEKEKKKKAKEDLALGDGEEVSDGNILAPEPPASTESAMTSEAQAEADGETDQAQAEAASETDQAQAGDESYEQATAEDEERLGRPAEESEPREETWVNDEAWVENEAWVEDDDDVNDPDID
jgi:hypothetical protein